MTSPAELTEHLRVPAARVEPLREVLDRLRAARRVVLTTHLNADGDGAGCEAAVSAWLEDRGVRTAILNPTGFPRNFRFVLRRKGAVAEWNDGAGAGVLADADLVLVLDTGEPARLGPLTEYLPQERVLVIDHHPPGPGALGGGGLRDPTAAATGELIYDLLQLAHEDEWPVSTVEGLYVALVTDTGSFRYANTTPRAHLIAADLLRRGIDPEAMYRRIYGAVPPQRLALLRRALGALEIDSDAGLSWLLITKKMMSESGATTEDLDGVVEQARSVEGTEVAIMFRELPQGGTKMSFRSNGDTDVNRIARAFGGGGHVKAAGATVAEPPTEVIPRVLDTARAALRGLYEE